MTPDAILHGISHANLMLYASAIPPIDTDGKGDKENKGADDESRNLDNLNWGGALDCNNPDNYTDLDLPEE